MALSNVGNTCFMNAAIQCLVHIPMLNDLLDAVKMEYNTPERVLVKEYNDLRLLMTQHKVITPLRFVSYVRFLAKLLKKSEFVSTAQNDVSEFIRFMIETLHVAMKIPLPANLPLYAPMADDFSAIIPIFYGLTSSTIDQSVTTEPFFMLEVPVPPTASTLNECIDAYLAPEEVTLNGTAHKKMTKIVLMPPVLIITLKLFNPNGLKKTCNLYLPEKFNLGHGMYSITSVCNHSGGANGGHYTTCIKREQWIRFDDTEVSPTDDFAKNAYCIIYTKNL